MALGVVVYANAKLHLQHAALRLWEELPLHTMMILPCSIHTGPGILGEQLHVLAITIQLRSKFHTIRVNTTYSCRASVVAT